jgi:putative ATP-binding cassette transporter
VFLDEATSALDELSQRRAMSIFDRELDNTTVLSIGHRPGLEQFHTRVLHLVRTPNGARLHNAEEVAAIANADGKIEIFGQRTAARA